MRPALLGATRHGRAMLVVLAALMAGMLLVKLEVGIALFIPATLGALVLVVLVRYLIRWPDDPDAQRRIMWWVGIAFSSHLLIGLVISSSPGMIAYFGGDAVAYHNVAKELVLHWTQGLPLADNGTGFLHLPAGKEGYYIMMGWVYRLLGPHRAAGIAINATLGAALIPVVSDTTRRLFGTRAARYVAPLVALLPGFMIFTSQLLKEAAILLMIAIVANLACRMTERLTATALIVVPLCLLLLFTFRAWVALVVAAGVLLGVAFGSRALLGGLGTGLGTLMAAAALMLGSGLGYTGYKTASSTDLERAHIVRQDLADRANTGYAPEADISTPQRALSFAPQGLAIFTFGPIPWELRGARQLAIIPDVVVWWVLLPSLWRGLREGRALVGRKLLVLTLPALGTSLLLALAIGNYGTMVRERMQVVILVVPMIALGLASRAARREATKQEPESQPLVVGGVTHPVLTPALRSRPV